jgi:hypothetical protein
MKGDARRREGGIVTESGREGKAGAREKRERERERGSETE